MRRFYATSLLLLYPAYAAADDVFTATFPEHLDHVKARLCFDGQAPDRLYRHKNAGDFANGIFHDRKRLKVSGNGSSLRLPALPDNACIYWQTNFKTALKKKDYRLILKTGEDLVMSADLWFWKGPRNRDIVVDVHLPDSMSISAPWMLLDRAGKKTRYRPDKTSANWDSRVAIGHFKVQNIEVPGARVRMAAVGNLSATQIEKLRFWIEETVTSVTTVNGHFPQPQPQVLVVAIGKRREAVVTAHVMRGGGLSAEFFVDETRPLEEFTGDWTATHEFSHMLVPYISSRDRWLSEGLASYYQNVLRARNGRLTETQAWQKLYEGFKRGENGTHGGSLAEATRNGWRSTMRVYWSGAALMLKADTQLRETSGGSQSLDTALQSLSACCMKNGRTWRARELFTQLDKLTGTTIFTELYKKHVHEEGFPDMRTTWENLGIKTWRDRVSLSEDAPLAGVRSAIMKG
jgi:predicted metalloprotease with PDZ domain